MIRKATMADVANMHALLNGYADKGMLIGRSISSIYDKLRDFFVYVDNEQVVGMCALQISWDNLAEIRSLAVSEDYHSKGLGRELVLTCLAEAEDYKINKIFTLTYADEFFRKLGFYDIDKKELPHKIWSDCMHCPKFPNCDENALMFDQ
ncbi:MAG: N-acetyltransferase [Desulfotalea sp.]